jgi:hypothetical protein
MARILGKCLLQFVDVAQQGTTWKIISCNPLNQFHLCCRYAVQAREVMAEKPLRISWVGWKPPDVGWVKLITDGACKEAYTAGCGGILHNNNGEWLGGFAKQIGICSAAFMADLWGVLVGLRFAWRMGYIAVELEVDSTLELLKLFVPGQHLVLWE